ncbi:MAG: VCBS domain-containing protein [Oleiphilaceae bacterium]|nr:VCBS domain-containing protein [Oleiphilaceae bacterium]
MSVSPSLVLSVSGPVSVATSDKQTSDILSAQQSLQQGDLLITGEAPATVILAGPPATTLHIPANSQASVGMEGDNETLRLIIEEQIAALQQDLLNDEAEINELEATAAGNAETSEGSAFGSPAPLLELDETTLLTPRPSSNAEPMPVTQSKLELETTPPTTEELLGVTSNAQAENTTSFAAVTEDFQIISSGVMDGNNQAQSFTTEYGHFSIDASGQWQYVLNNAHSDVQALGAGKMLNEEILIDSGRIVITVHGSNDQASITGDSRAYLKDIGDDHTVPIPVASGKLDLIDTDAGEARFEVVFGQDTRFGEIDILGDGQWTYRLDTGLDAIRGLAEGERITDYVAVTTLDGSRHTLRIEIEGSNHSAQIHSEFSPNADPSLPNGVEIDLSQAITASGKLGVLDPDFGQSHFAANDSIQTKLGTASIDSEGNWQYQLDTQNSKILTLQEGSVLRDFIRVYSADDTSYDLIVTVHGSDQPIFTTAALFDDQQDQLLLSQSAPEHESELFIWQPEQSGSEEHIADFHAVSGGDTLVLSEVLIEDSAHPEDNLHFVFDGDSTTIELSSAGGTQQLVLDHIDLSHFGSNDAEIIQNLIAQGNLDIVSAG